MRNCPYQLKFRLKLNVLELIIKADTTSDLNLILKYFICYLFKILTLPICVTFAFKYRKKNIRYITNMNISEWWLDNELERR